MIEIYLKTNDNYDKNGDITLDPTSCTYKESEKEVTLEHFLDEEGRWKYINFENVIATEENGKKKLYRIYNVIRSLYSVTAYARPIFYDLIDKVLLDVRPTDKIAEEALNIILDGTGFKGHSNLTSINTSYYIRKNIVEALIGDENNSFLNRWGGEFYCENFDVYINDRIGSDNGVRVEFGYNLNEIEEDVNIEEVVTRIIPVGYNGIMLEGKTPWVDSPLINKYTQPKMRVIEFSDIKVKESSDDEEGFDTIEEARAELIKQCNLLFENGIDKPIVNYKIDMINLANTTAYKDFEMLVNVNKGDTVTCYIPHLNIDVQARVIDFEKDLLTGEYISIELGNATNDFFKNQSDIQNKVDSIFNDNGNVKAETLEGAINALQTKFKALRDIAQPQSVRAILFEDRIEDSPTFGCMCLGTMGFEIASKFKPGTKDWDFRTFGTGQGFVADYIITGVLNAALIKAGILKSENEKTWINMEDGTFDFADKIKFDGTNFSIDLSGEDLTTNESIKSAFKIMNDSITSKVSSEDFETYKEQTDKSISSKVSNGDFETYKEQTAKTISSKVSNGDFTTYKEQTAETISSKVSKDDLGTLIEQSSSSVKIAWNNSSKYVQFEYGGLAIYDGAISSSKKRAFFDERGNHFWRDGYYLGKIGTNELDGDSSIKGIVFDLEAQGGYMTWARKKTSTSLNYDVIWTYANKKMGAYDAGMLHAGCDIDMHYHTLKNVSFEGGGITGTLNFVQIVEVGSNGVVQRWVNNCQMKFENGILTYGRWGNV